jgi:hypothetical protein
MPDFNQVTPFKTACKAVEQVIECEIQDLNFVNHERSMKKYYPELLLALMFVPSCVQIFLVVFFK